MDNLLNGLNEAQKSAVTSEASVLQVLAPPGSGKTKTLTARVAYLVAHQGFKPWNIIVCTFTLKAAREMKERIRGMVGDQIESKLILGTFHSVARRFLVRYGQEIGIEKNFSIADTSDSKAIIKRIITRNNYSVEPDPARSRISGLKAKGTTADQFAATSKKAEQHEFACVYSEYEETLKASNLLDYDDLLLRCTDLLAKHPACVSSIQAVLIDEYQDTNNVQYTLMSLLAQRMKRITIVGDPDQSIYGFRSAEIKNLYRMRDDYPDSVVINLENNYRSSGCILRSALAVIEQDENRPSKLLVPTHCTGEQPTLRHLATKDVEARWIVEEITRSKNLAAGLLNFNDYAILLRTSTLSMSIEKALGKAGIPYRMVGGRRFFDRAEIKIVLDYLRVINQPDHNDALIRVLNVPTRKIGDVTIKGLLDEAESRKVTLWSLILDSAQGRSRPRTKIATQAQKGIDTFVNLVLTSRKKLFPNEGENCNLIDLIGHVLQKISFQIYLKNTHKDNWEERWDNVNELVAQATQMSAMANGDDADALPVVEGVEQRQDTAADALSKFLANVALATEVEKPDGEEQNQVTLSTIHAAKGLEWPIVFIPGVYDGSIPHSRAEDHDEERRLLYVGMTRAQGLLYVTCPYKQSSSEETVLSKFISSRKIQKHFNSQGPTFGTSTIKDLGQILRRPCPSDEEIRTARSLEECPEDVRYVLTREEIDGEEGSWTMSNPNNGTRYNMANPGGDTQQPFKRRKVGSTDFTAHHNTAVTMQSANYSVSHTTLQGPKPGFTTASAVKVQQEERLLNEAKAVGALLSAPSIAAGKSAYKQVKRIETKSSAPKVPKPRPAGQGSIANFFTKPSMARAESADALLPTARNPTLQRSQSANSPAGPLSDISNVSVNQNSFKPRKPLNTPLLSKPKRYTPEPDQAERYILLSSSPVRAEDCSTANITEEQEQDDTRKPTGFVKAASTNHPNFKPATTFHNTSTSQAQSNAAPIRRGLGMRRPMQPWSVKHQQPPRPQQ